MSLDITAAVHIRRPLPQVAAYMIDPLDDPEWIGGIQEVRILGAEPVGPGSRVARVARFLGRRIEYVNEILALDPERCLDMRSVQAPFPMRITYSFGEEDGGTVVRNRVRGDVRGFFAVLGPVLAPLVRRSVQRDLERLRHLLEEHGAG
jgi:ligand-binding SRPBCC domain-containing protein